MRKKGFGYIKMNNGSIFWMFTFAYICLSLQTDVFALTRSQIREQVRYAIQDTTDTTTSSRWPDPILNIRINMAQDQIVRYVLPLYGETLISPTTGQAEYTKPTNCITIDRVAYHISGSTWAYKKLQNQTIGGIDRDEETWEKLVYDSSGTPLYYLEKGNEIIIKPAPNKDYSKPSAIKVYFYKRAAEMDSDDDTPFDNDGTLYIWHDLLVTGVIAMCKWDEKEIQEYQLKMGEFQMGLDLMKRRVEFLPDMNASLRINTP